MSDRDLSAIFMPGAVARHKLFPDTIQKQGYYYTCITTPLKTLREQGKQSQSLPYASNLGCSIQIVAVNQAAQEWKNNAAY
jgi:hypothetical protein